MAGFGHLKQVSPVILAGLCFMLFAPIELVVGYLFQNPAISANAAHDAYDGLFFLVGGSLDTMLSRSSRHALYCWSRKGLSIFVGLLASVFVGIGLVHSQSSNVTDSSTGKPQLIAALLLGPISIALNWFWHRRLANHGDAHHHGYKVDLLVDMGSGFVVIIAAIVTFVSGNAMINLLGGYLILLLAIALGLQMAYAALPTLLHRKSNHPAIPDHDH